MKIIKVQKFAEPRDKLELEIFDAGHYSVNCKPMKQHFLFSR